MLTRREFVAGAGALLPAAAFSTDSPVTRLETVRPPALRKEDAVAILAPAGFIDNQVIVQRDLVKIAGLGYRPMLGKHTDDRYGYFAGKDEVRADDLNAAFRDPDVRAIFALRGGYGCARTLPYLDYDAFKQDPKIVVGYSDVTALLVALQRRTGVVTFHGPVADSTFSEFSVDWFKRAVENPEPLGPFPVLDETKTLVPGKAEGRLVGGNLSVLESIRGTPHAADLDGAVLFLEDVNEDPYRIDRMLTSFLLSGEATGLKGLVFGQVTPPKPKPDEKPDPGFTMDEVLLERARAFRVPAYSGLATGHMNDKLTLPIGVMAAIDADQRTLTVLEPGVASRG